MRWLLLLTITVLLPLASAQPAWAQAVPPALVVQLHDATGAGVAGVTVTVTDRSGTTVLARGTSGPDGSVPIGPLPAAEVRVQVAGRLANGTPLHQPGADARGIAVTLGAPPVTLALRSEADGTVLPDPAVALTLELGVAAPDRTIDPAQLPPAPPAAAAAAPRTATAAAPPAQLASPAATTPQAATAAAPATAPTAPPATPGWMGLLLLGLFVLLPVIMLVTYRCGGDR